MSGVINFKFRSANFKVELHSVFNFKVGIASKRFFFNGNHDQLFDGLKGIALDLTSKSEEYPVRVVCKDLVNNKSKSFTFYSTIPKDKESLIQFQDDFRDRINYIEDTLDTNADVYRVSIDNHLSNEFDTKCFRFQSLQPEKNIIDSIKSRMELLSQKIQDENSGYVFDGDTQDSKTHRVLITKANHREDGVKYLNLQSFTMRFPNHSSAVIIQRFLEEKL